VEVEHGELLEAYIANIVCHERISNSQASNEREVQPTKNCPKVALGQISSFFGNPPSYKKHEEC
jgi:hypothetical protein